MHLDIVTIFPEMFPAILNASILGIAQEKQAVTFGVHNFREFSRDRHQKVDDRPFGGGPGMVLQPGPIFDCIESLQPESEPEAPIIVLSPQGEVYNQQIARELCQEDRLILLAGRYEGFDQRIIEGLPVREISIGDYILTGGELAALVLIDSIVRLLPGVLGDADSATFESFNDGLLDHPHYTRPVEFRGMKVPEVLRSGDHARIAAWRHRKALELTRKRRPDLLQRRDLQNPDQPDMEQ